MNLKLPFTDTETIIIKYYLQMNPQYQGHPQFQ